MLIVLSCILVVASAAPNSYYYNSRHPQYQQTQRYQIPSYIPAAPAAPVAPVVPVVAPAIRTAPVAVPVASDFGLGSLSSLASIDFSSITSFSSLMALLPKIWPALDKASKSLEGLSNDLPAALSQIPPEIKADVEKVIVTIGEVCDRVTEESNPTDFSYYSKEGIIASCRVIKKTGNDIVLGFDDPSALQNLVAKVLKMTKMLQGSSYLFE